MYNHQNRTIVALLVDNVRSFLFCFTGAVISLESRFRDSLVLVIIGLLADSLAADFDSSVKISTLADNSSVDVSGSSQAITVVTSATGESGINGSGNSSYPGYQHVLLPAVSLKVCK